MPLDKSDFFIKFSESYDLFVEKISLPATTRSRARFWIPPRLVVVVTRDGDALRIVSVSLNAIDIYIVRVY